MSEYLSAAEVEQWISDCDGVDSEDKRYSATLREAWAIVQATAERSAPVPVWVQMFDGHGTRCEWCGRVWAVGAEEIHSAGCIGLRARRLVGKA